MPQNEVLWKHYSIRSIFNIINSSSAILRGQSSKSFHSKIPLNTGFTIIELITAIGVLALLSSVVMAVINPLEQFRKTQDTRRKSDLAQVQRILEIYYNDFGRYPARTTTGTSLNRICKDLMCAEYVNWGQSWSPYMDVLPLEPNGSKNYAYWTDSTGQQYAIYASLDRGGKDPQACTGANNICTNLPSGVTCGGGVCNYGVTSPNRSP